MGPANQSGQIIWRTHSDVGHKMASILDEATVRFNHKLSLARP
jgi:hypothetical protein